MAETVIIGFYFFVLIFSAIVHEVAHGYVAERLGDPTARLAGRLTLNPVSHIDPFGSIILPLLLYFGTGGSVVFGWAKPVPYNPHNLKDPVMGGAKIAAAGPLSNILIAFIFGITMRIMVAGGYGESMLISLFAIIVYTNIVLAVFNLVPIPPLDGSKVLFGFLPRTAWAHEFIQLLERYGTMLLIFFIFFGFELIIPIIRFLYALIAGSSFGV